MKSVHHSTTGCSTLPKPNENVTYSQCKFMQQKQPLQLLLSRAHYRNIDHGTCLVRKRTSICTVYIIHTKYFVCRAAIMHKTNYGENKCTSCVSLSCLSDLFFLYMYKPTMYVPCFGNKSIVNLIMTFPIIVFITAVHAMDWLCTSCQTQRVYFKTPFINTPDSFATPIGGERVTWGCLNGW